MMIIHISALKYESPWNGLRLLRLTCEKDNGGKGTDPGDTEEAATAAAAAAAKGY